MLITKGDLLHQRSKMERSGLRDRFAFVEVVSEKTPAVYREILARHHVDPDSFLMVGNSVRSDIVPVLQLGAWAVHVPAALSWAHEEGEVPDAARERYVEIPTLRDLPALVGRLKPGGTVS
jgi:putative hydrolase of the HAD superfamily